MTSLQMDGISFGKLPSMQEILAREEYAQKKLRKSFFYVQCATECQA